MTDEPMTAALPPFDVCCPTCGSLMGERCKTLKTARTTDTHHERHQASWKWRAFGSLVAGLSNPSREGQADE